MTENNGTGLEMFLPKITTNRRYWLVRSMGGDYYGEYITRGFIAIGYNEISLKEIKLAISHDEKASEQLRLIVESKDLKPVDVDDEPYNSSYATTQMLKFYSEINIGDIVIIPGKKSYAVAIAEVTSNVYEEKNISPLTGYCQFKKRRNIKVLEKTSRPKLNPEMQLMFSSRHIISNVDKYAEFIDGCVRDFYRKGDTTYLVLRVKQEEEISAIDFNLVPEIINIIDDFTKENEIEFDKQSVKMKICVQSPGDILIFAQEHPEYIFLIGLIIGWLKGGELKITEHVKLKIPSALENIAHLIGSLSEFLDRKNDRAIKETMRKKLENMEIETPDDIKKILQEFNKGREKY